MEPAPIAIVVSAGSRPSDCKSGAMILAVVTIATVEEPCAVFSAAAMRKGRNMPSGIVARFVLMKSVIGLALMIAPKEPPAAVITRIIADSLMPCPIQSESACALSSFSLKIMNTAHLIKALLRDLRQRRAEFEIRHHLEVLKEILLHFLKE